jgi:penicillin-binding protein 2
LGIGQGYNNFTMLQLAHAMATVLAGGQRHAPRVVREVQDVVTRGRSVVDRPEQEPLAYKPEHVEAIRRAMQSVTQEGTSTRVFAGAPYTSGGKTGTAQAVSIRQNEKYNAAKLTEYQRDHSLYVAFAPASQPTIALAVIVENAGFGAAAAAPIARRVFDYWLEGRWPSEEDIAATQRGESAAPIGAPRRALDVALPGSMPPEPALAPTTRVANWAESGAVSQAPRP